MQSVDVLPQDIMLTSDNLLGEKKPLADIRVERSYKDAWSFRFGADYAIIAERLKIRGGYVYETSAAADDAIGVDNANWGRQALGVGVSLAMFGAWFDIGYGHHFIPTQNVSKSRLKQTVTPCLMYPGCEDTAPASIGNGKYEGSFDIVALSVRMNLDSMHAYF